MIPRHVRSAVPVLAVVLAGAITAPAYGSIFNPAPNEKGRALVTKIVDGDTVVLNGVVKARLIGVDTPERGQCYYGQASRFTARKLLYRIVRYEVGKDTRDRYGRVLVYITKKGGSFNESLLRWGYARTLPIRPNTKYGGKFSRLQDEARKHRRGTWKYCGRGRRS